MRVEGQMALIETSGNLETWKQVRRTIKRERRQAEGKIIHLGLDQILKNNEHTYAKQTNKKNNQNIQKIKNKPVKQTNKITTQLILQTSNFADSTYDIYIYII